MSDPREHWVNNPLITPVNKVVMFEDAVRAAKAEAWDEAIERGEKWGLIAPGEAVNPYRKEAAS